jgi:hypothetical protein
MHPGYFLVGGILWGFAIGSRLTQILPIGFLTMMITLLVIQDYFNNRSTSNTLTSIVSLGIPLALGAAAVGWYNWARFGSLLESGYSYQITTSNMQKYKEVLFSWIYILPNSYEYFLARPKILGEFPFFQPVRGKAFEIFSFLRLPKIYFTRATTGIIYSTPFILFAGIPILSMLFPKTGLKGLADARLLKWLIVSLMGAFLLGMIPFITFFWVEARYFIDFTPSLIMLSIIGFWLGYNFLIDHPTARKIYTLAGVCLMFISVFISSLLVLAFRSQIYQVWHPSLWSFLSSLFSIFSRQ